jgi:hypothetical protein
MHSIANEIVAGRRPRRSSRPAVSLFHIAPSGIHLVASALRPATSESP